MNIFGSRQTNTEAMINKRIRSNELADSYRQIQKTSAWKHLMEVMAKIKDDSVKTIDAKSVNDITPNDAGWVKGRREAIDIVMKEIEFTLGGI